MKFPPSVGGKKFILKIKVQYVRWDWELWRKKKKKEDK